MQWSLTVFNILLTLVILSVRASNTEVSDGSDKANDPARSKCFRERASALKVKAAKDNEVLVPTCKPDGHYHEVQCHLSLKYCWCVTWDGRHIQGTAIKNKRPRCKVKRRRRKGKGGKSKKRKNCNSKDRQTFNTGLIKVFKEEYKRVHPVKPGDTADDFASEKAIILWKFAELDINKDGILKFKELRNFARIVKKLIKPRACAKRLVRHCDKKKDRKIEKQEWTICLGVDIKPGRDADTGGSSGARKRGPLDRIAKGLAKLQPVKPPGSSVKLPPLRADLSAGSSQLDTADRKDALMNCREQRTEALTYDSQEPDAKHFIPACTPSGLWQKAQCHLARGYCWCVEERTGNPIAGTAAYNVTPNCSFENDREMKGCPFEEKRRFLVDLIGDLTSEWKIAMSNQTHSSRSVDHLTLRETVARWKLKTLDVNNNGVLERKEWKTMRRTTLKNKTYPRKCRRNFVRYCDEDNSKRITLEEWKSCLGLNEYNFNSLPLNPEKRGKNPFVDQLT